MELEIAEIKRNYSRLSNERLIRIATEDAYSLRPEALIALKQILNERKIPENIFRGIDAQLVEVNESMLEEYAEILREQPCPIANQQMKN